MSYEVEHDIKAKADNDGSTHHRHRPDMSSFFAALSELRTDSPSHNNSHAVPTPVSVASLYTLLATSFSQQLVDVPSDGAGSEAQRALLTRLQEELLSDAADPPTEIKGVSQTYIDALERVSKVQLLKKKDDVCPICAEPFLDDPYPLVVQLPCHPNHRFDLECVAPWLKLQGTCPLDRKELGDKKKPGMGRGEKIDQREASGQKEDDEDREDYDDIYL